MISFTPEIVAACAVFTGATATFGMKNPCEASSGPLLTPLLASLPQASRSAFFSSMPISGLCANGLVGLRACRMSSSRVCTEPIALGWL